MQVPQLAPQTWWIYPGVFSAGPYPNDFLKQLLQSGITSFVCLLEPIEVNKHYKDELPSHIRFKNFPIKYQTAPSVEMMNDILQYIGTEIHTNQKVYLHGWSGHGRTATVVACFLKQLGFYTNIVLNCLSGLRSHDSRLTSQLIPQTQEQLQFIDEWPSIR